tara:strand:+ start:5605 stop:6243 length:639 start_codon:yes stop_codon:yes gene_type:complete
MPRKKLIRTNEFPYHITTRTNNKEHFCLNTKQIWTVFIKHLEVLKNDYSCRIHAFLLMNNHYHLIISTPLQNISESIQHLNGSITRITNKMAKRENHLWGSRYRWCVINNEKYYWNAVKYVFNNPVRAGLTNYVEDYPYSSLNYQRQELWEMVDFFHRPMQKIELDKEWLNYQFSKEQNESIRKGLKKRLFDISPDKNRRTVELNGAAFFIK